MSTWRIHRHYGFGAAQIPLQAEMHRSADASLLQGCGAFLRELTEGGVGATMRRLVTESPMILLGLLLCSAFALTLMRDRSDVSPIELVMMETPSFVPEPPIEVLAEIEPPAPIPPPELPAPTPPPAPIAPDPPPPPKLAKRVEPAPAPARMEVKPKPRPRPLPVMPQIARIESPKVDPVVRPARPVHERPPTIDRPRVDIDQLAPEPRVAAPSTERVARASALRPALPRNTPKLAAPTTPVLEAPPSASPERTFRVAKSPGRAGQPPKPIPGLAPAPARHAAPPPAPGARLDRTAHARPARAKRPKSPTPALASAAVPAALSPRQPAPRREARAVPRASERSGRRPNAELARAPRMPQMQAPAPLSRATRAAPTTALASQGDRPGVAGVPLGELVACVSDREEDRLKQAVVAAVKTQETCVSRKGTYRFVETKNLNAFLMWIDRASTRQAEDRCVELRNALECLESASQRAAR